MTTSHFEMSWAAIGRARKFLEEAESLIPIYKNKDSIFISEIRGNPLKYYWYAQGCSKDEMRQLPLIFGDGFNNARKALNYMFKTLAEKNGEDANWLKFPILPEEKLDRALQPLDKSHAKLIKKIIDVYQKDILEPMNVLRNIDQHDGTLKIPKSLSTTSTKKKMTLKDAGYTKPPLRERDKNSLILGGPDEFVTLDMDTPQNIPTDCSFSYHISYTIPSQNKNKTEEPSEELCDGLELLKESIEVVEHTLLALSTLIEQPDKLQLLLDIGFEENFTLYLSQDKNDDRLWYKTPQPSQERNQTTPSNSLPPSRGQGD